MGDFVFAGICEDSAVVSPPCGGRCCHFTSHERGKGIEALASRLRKMATLGWHDFSDVKKKHTHGKCSVGGLLGVKRGSMSNLDSYFVFLNKSPGLTSQQCLSVFKRVNHQKKVGHHGTLDPFAEGLLLVATGEATKFLPFVDDSEKTYVARLLLGQATDTLEVTGKVICEKPVPLFDAAQLEKIFAVLKGAQKQRPPMYSAVKKNGVRLYDLARQGIELERDERDIFISDLSLLGVETGHIDFSATVSRGTYIRVLAETIAERLGTVGHLSKLTRTRLCGRELCVAHGDVNQPVPESLKIPIPKLLDHMPSKVFSLPEAGRLLKGQQVVMGGGHA